MMTILCVLILLKVVEVHSAVSSCNALLTGISGTFTSPNYPHIPPHPSKSEISTSYPDQRGFVTCKWEIEVPPDKGIQLKFGHFDMALNALDDCDKGEVEVFNGTGKQMSSLDKYCPGNKPDTLSLLDNTATVVFRRPPDFQGTGFLISYIAVPPGETYDDFVTCTATGAIHAGVESFSVVCPSGCASIEEHSVWGTKEYRGNSHLCRAAVHAGVISDEFGGRVDVKRQTGMSFYPKEKANNITTQTGTMSDSLIVFLGVSSCHKLLNLQGKQFSSSSYWNTTDKEGRQQLWLPEKAVLSSPSGAWSPADPSTQQQWLQIDFDKAMDVTGIVITGSSQLYIYAESFVVKFSHNNIFWHDYTERDHRKAKVFAGSSTYFGRVRNNFVEPIIRSRHIRVYPMQVSTGLGRYALKVDLMGCAQNGPLHPKPPSEETAILIPEDHSPKPAEINAFSTTSTNDVPKISNYSMNHETRRPVYSSAHVVSTAIPYIPDGDDANMDDIPVIPVDDNPGKGTNDLSERSVMIIGIVAALAIISILLAALVLFLVRKRKKEPKADTVLPKINSQTNATYNTATGMNYLHDASNGGFKRVKKKSENGSLQNMQFKNDNFRDTYPMNGFAAESPNSNNRGTLPTPYDQSSVNRNILYHKGSTVPANSSYSTKYDGAGPSALHSAKQTTPNDDNVSFTSDEEDHEYQVIPDPVNNYNNRITPSKDSPGSRVGLRSKASDPGLRLQGSVWGTERGKLSSFSLQNSSKRGQVSRVGFSSHPLQSSTNDEEADPLLSQPPKTTPPDASFVQPRFSTRRGNENQSQNPPQRYSSSSSGSSSQVPFDAVSSLRDSTTAPYYASVPEDIENGLPPENRILPPKIAKRKPSYNIPNNEPLGTPTSDSNGHATNYNGLDRHSVEQNGTAIGSGVHRSSSRNETLNQAKLRSGYDHLYRNKSITGSEGINCVVAMETNEYDQLNLNAAN